VDDLAACLKKAESMGGKTVVPPTEIPDMVTFAQFQDPEGNIVGLVKG
jgi:predicted enzyme related to lactoylglutathione lyase